MNWKCALHEFLKSLKHAHTHTHTQTFAGIWKGSNERIPVTKRKANTQDDGKAAQCNFMYIYIHAYAYVYVLVRISICECIAVDKWRVRAAVLPGGYAFGIAYANVYASMCVCCVYVCSDIEYIYQTNHHTQMEIYSKMNVNTIKQMQASFLAHTHTYIY